MRLKKAVGGMKPAFIHNPNHFYSNSFERDYDLLGRTVVTGRARGKKNFRMVAILKHPKRGILE